MSDLYFWISFADEEGFKGVIITRSTDFLSAIMKTHSLGINPGGEGYSIETPIDHEGMIEEINKFGLDRLILKSELEGPVYGTAAQLGATL